MMHLLTEPKAADAEKHKIKYSMRINHNVEGGQMTTLSLHHI